MNDKKDYGEVKIDGKVISSSWWGQMWCRNIENYSNIRNRLERGRTYIRQNTVKSLSISNNCAESQVQGHSKEPYRVIINIKTIEKSKYDNILNKCENSVDNLESLMTGSFPKEYQQFFTDEEYGLFPKSNEIDYNCTCLDYEKNMHMCKHIAATMYAIGNKLDNDPLIFFKLRGIDISEFSNKILKKETEFVWNNINGESNRKINSNDISFLFGVDCDEIDDENNEVDTTNIEIKSHDIDKDKEQEDSYIPNIASQNLNESNNNEKNDISKSQITSSNNSKKSIFEKILGIFKKN